MQIALFPGSFDPLTKGHVEIITKGLSVFDKVIVFVNTRFTAQTVFKTLHKDFGDEVAVFKAKGITEQVFDNLIDFKLTPKARVLVIANEDVGDHVLGLCLQGAPVGEGLPLTARKLIGGKMYAEKGCGGMGLQGKFGERGGGHEGHGEEGQAKGCAAHIVL